MPFLLGCSNNSSDKFLGRWVYCDEPDAGFVISKKEGEYHIKTFGFRDNEYYSESLKKSANDVLSGRRWNLVFSKSNSRLISSNDSEEFCRSD
jgi:hypothetical protein